MQSYSTIIGVIELRLQGIGYLTTQRRYDIGSSTVTLIMNRFKEIGIPLDELKAMLSSVKLFEGDFVRLFYGSFASE